MRKIMIYDVETIHGPDEVKGGWDNPMAMGLASAVVFNWSSERYHIRIAGQRESIADILQGNLAVGFNSDRFDSRVILGNDRVIKKRKTVGFIGMKIFEWISYDIMAEYVTARFFKGKEDEERLDEFLRDPANHGHGVFSLNSLCKGTLGMHKIESGKNAPKMYEKGEWGKLIEYNLQDVRLTSELFTRICESSPLIGGDGVEVILRNPLKNNGQFLL